MMAVIDDVPGIAVGILVDGQPLEEYIDPDAAARSRVAERYIEAFSNKRFAIELRFDKDIMVCGDGVTVRVVIDGVLIDHVCYLKEKIETGGRFTIEGRYTSNDRIQYFSFSELEIGKRLNIPGLFTQY